MTGTDYAMLTILAVIVLTGLFLFVSALIEPTRLQIAYFKLRAGTTSEGERREFEALQSELQLFPAVKANEGPRMIFFSDYHAGLMRVPLPVFINSILQLKPELVLFGGDLATNAKDKEKALAQLEMISSALLAEDIPFIGVRGNHDTVLSRDEMEERAMILLQNQSTVFRAANGQDWLIVGLDDERTGQPDFNEAKSNLVPKTRQLQLKPRADLIPAKRTIVLAHNPDSSLKLPAESLSYAFSGHYHGGQINLPFKLGYRSLRTDHAWRAGYLKGLYRYNDYDVFISRGVGSVQIPLRLFSKPELAVFDFIKQ